MYKEDLAKNNLQWLIRHKTQSNQTNPTQPKPNQTKPDNSEEKMIGFMYQLNNSDMTYIFLWWTTF